MSTPRSTTTSRDRRFRRTLAGVGLSAALLLAACGGDDDDTSATTTTTAGDEGEETTSTTAPDGADEAAEGEVPAEELEALLPDASAIGPGYTEVAAEEDDDSGDDEATQQALEEACPDAAELLADADDEDDEVEREFAGEHDRSVTVGFDPTPRNLEDDSLDQVVDAINSCQPASVTQDGFDMTLELAAERDDTYGERGALVDLVVTMAHPQLPEPLTMDFRMRVFLVGSVSATIEVSSGIDESTVTPVPGDFDLLDSLAPQLEADLEALAG